MRGVCFESVERVDWIELADPQLLDPKDAIIQVEVAGMCGSDLHAFFGREQGLDTGTVMGHEFVGRVIEIGSECARSPLAIASMPLSRPVAELVFIACGD